MHTTDRLAARQRRLAAAGTVGVVSVTVAAAGHAAAGGGTPSVVALVLALIVSGLIGMAVVGPRLTRGRALVGVILDQLAFHALFAFFGPASASTGSGMAAPGAHAAHDGATSGVPSLLMAGDAIAASSGAMIVAHLATAALAYAMLWRGMTALDVIIASVASALGRLVFAEPIVIGIPTARHAVATGVAPFAGTLARRRLPDRRGPPVLAVC